MFSFHKPRVYRSVSGCCICRAKSSSSRFTDSKRYEDVFYECFKLREHRSGEICNACVLLVKRWKKLPVGSHKHWHHVVDARAGHGSKPISKINKVKKLNKVKGAATGKKVVKVIKSTSTMLKEVEHVAEFQQVTVGMKKKLYSIPEITTTNSSKRKRTASPSAFSDDVHFAVDCLSSESGSGHSSLDTSPVPSPVNFDEEDCISTAAAAAGVLERKEKLAEKNNSGRRRVKSLIPQKNRATMSSFLDLTFWKREKTCCGIIFKGPFGEVLLDRRFLNPCYCRSSSSNPSSTLPSPTGGPKTTSSAGLDCFALRNFDDEDEDEDEVEDEEEDEVDDEDELASNASLETFLSGPATGAGGGPVKDNSGCIGGSFVANFALKVD